MIRLVHFRVSITMSMLAAAAIVMSCGATAQSVKAKQSITHPADDLLFKSMKARSIGPAVMGGRVEDIALDPVDPYTFYVGLATGGVMKTSNNGGSFSGVFEKEAVSSIGAIAVSPRDPKMVWVGTGEADDRNSASWGNGVYLSTDGGSSWTNVGLKSSRTIARIVAHPQDSATAYVAAMGDLWNSGGERGLYKTTNRGQSWEPVLAAPSSYRDRVGCGDVVLDPVHPDTLYAAMYARQRSPWSFVYGTEFTNGKDLGGIFKSTDGGRTWIKLTEGLPANTGRIGLTIFKKNPQILYAVIQSDEGGTSSIDDVKSKKGGVFRTDDGGAHWTRTNPLNPRPFYFSQIRVDPENDKRVYVLGYMLHVSDNGGQAFQEDFFDKVHSDCHALEIDPRNTKRLILGTDGGAYQSFTGGKGWEYLNRFAGGEYYRITLDMSVPYRIAGGLQDNNNWVGPNMTRTKEGILNSDWTDIGGGDGFYCAFDPEDSNVVYAESQQGYVHRLNLRTGEFKGLRPEPAEGQPAFRYHWNSPLIASRHQRGVLYLAGNRIFKLAQHGEQWQTISPDLSSLDFKRYMATGSGAENFGVVYTLAESPLRSGLLWAGTDDGKLWITLDDGLNWMDLTKNLPGPVKGQWLTRIDPGNFDDKVAYLAVDAHRTGNYGPLVYRTRDAGKSWENIGGDLPSDGPVKVLREDLRNPNVLFAGTEFGLFVSLNGGKHWIKLGGLPTAAVDDIQIHPRELDLVIATHGRSLFVLDHIRPLEELADSVLDKEAYLFPPRSARGYYPLNGIADWAGNAVYRGANPPVGALLSYYIRDYTAEPAKITVSDSSGRTVANLTAPAGPGLSRTSWDLNISHDLLNDYGGEGQKFVKSGDYTVTLSYGKTTMKQKLRVDIEPGIETR